MLKCTQCQENDFVFDIKKRINNNNKLERIVSLYTTTGCTILEKKITGFRILWKTSNCLRVEITQR
jgi:hypothetical protein